MQVGNKKKDVNAMKLYILVSQHIHIIGKN